ncbi:MAG: gliding motility-associated C-terminal domain-containing protein [Flavobacteriales bacterium]|nr:gliding motility-associated C-terminal domain-containing protein [Flavobacteriales bacterium]
MFHRFGLLTALMCSVTASNATHIIGGELYYDHLGGSQYQVTLKLYRDCTGIVFDPSAAIGVFDGVTNELIQVQSISFPGGSFIPITLDSPCLTLPPNVCVETTSYVSLFTLPPSPNGYVLSYQRCCRTSIINNLLNPGDLGLTVTTRIPGQSIPVNSSARFNELPPVALCLNAPLAFDHSATDPDGDSLVYSLTTPYNGGTSTAPQPNPPAAPPYALLPWGAGYSENYPMDSNPAIAIDPVTGLLTVTPTLQGNFTVGVMVQEYRSGVLLTETRRDFLFKVVACDATVTAGMAGQAASDYCDDLTIAFVNTSNGASVWHWDFGVPGVEDDTSNVQSPVFTFPEPGTYTVTQIANPGTTCADTTSAVFMVYFSPQPFFTPPPPFCGNDPVILVAEGVFGPNAVLQWQFGSGSVPPSSADSIVTVQFSGPGTHPVSLLVTENGCSTVFTESIVNHPQPDASFYALPVSPQPVGTAVNFTDTSDPGGGSISDWSWAIDGTVFAPSASTAVWNTDWPGTFLITLTVTDEFGCSDVASLWYTLIGEPIRIPNVFSPNGDGLNDAFHIENIQYYHNELTIYSRWGNKVYQVRNYKNQWKGEDLPEGTYYYVLQMDEGTEFSGHVTLLR